MSRVPQPVQKKCVLLLSPLKPFCGNTIHAKRLQSGIEHNGYCCILKDPSKLNHEMLQSIIDDNNVSMCIGMHALHSGMLLQGCNIPFGIILSGTDVNGWYTAEDEVKIMNTTLNKARYVLCLTEFGLEMAHERWPQVRHKVSVINHGVQTNPSSFNLHDYCQKNGIMLADNPTIFTLIGGIRPVKDPLFAVHAFQEFCSIPEKESPPNCILLVIGPILDDEYFPKFEGAIKHKSNIVFIPGLPVEDIHAVITQSFLVFNTSVSEGTPQVIMEACKLNVPVMVRDIPGNTALITHKHTGLVFSTMREFADGVNLLFKYGELRKHLVSNAFDMIDKKYSLAQERKTMCDFMERVINH